MKLSFLILSIVLSIESALAIPKKCDDFFSELEVLNLASAHILKIVKVIEKMIKTHTPQEAQAKLREALSNTQEDDLILRNELTTFLKIVDGNLMQSALSLLKNEKVSLEDKIMALDSLKFIENLSDEIIQTVIQVLEENSDMNLQRLAFSFLETKRVLSPESKEKIMNTLKLQEIALFLEHVLLEDQNTIDSSKRNEAIEKIIKTQKPQEAEIILRKTLLNVQNSSSRENLIHALLKIEGGLTLQTQLTLIELFESKDTHEIVKHATIKVLSEIENPSEAIDQLMIRISEEKNSNYWLKKITDKFLKRRIEKNGMKELQM